MEKINFSRSNIHGTTDGKLLEKNNCYNTNYLLINSKEITGKFIMSALCQTHYVKEVINSL